MTLVTGEKTGGGVKSIRVDEAGNVVTVPPPEAAFAQSLTPLDEEGVSLPASRVASPLGPGPAGQAVRVLPADEYAREVGTADTASVSAVQRAPRVVHVASQQLPKGRVELNPTAYSVPAGCSGVTFFVTYTRGSVQGYPAVRIEQGNGTESGRELVIVSTTNAGVQRAEHQTIELPKPPDANSRTWAIPVQLGHGVSRVRLVPWEQGNADDTSTIAITVVAGAR